MRCNDISKRCIFCREPPDPPSGYGCSLYLYVVAMCHDNGKRNPTPPIYPLVILRKSHAAFTDFMRPAQDDNGGVLGGDLHGQPQVAPTIATDVTLRQ